MTGHFHHHAVALPLILSFAVPTKSQSAGALGSPPSSDYKSYLQSISSNPYTDILYPPTYRAVKDSYHDDRPLRPHHDDFVSQLRHDAVGQDATNAHHVGKDESQDDVRYCYPHKKRSDILFNFLRNGLPRIQHRRKKKKKVIIIVGAGISGLTAGYLLKEAGHKVVILEASNRAGGRIQTYRDLKEGWKTELGPMRLPHHHRFTHHLIHKFGLRTSLFLNKHADDYYYFRGRKFLQSAVDADVMRFFQKEFGLSDEEAATDPIELYLKALEPVVEFYFEHGDSEFLAKFDHYSLKDYLHLKGNLSLGAITLIGLFMNLEAYMNQGLAEAVLEECVFANTTLTKCTDGMDLIPRSFLPFLGQDIRYNAIVTKIRQVPHRGVSVEVDCTGVHCYDTETDHAADEVILTVSAPVSLSIEFEPMLSKNKSQALRSVHYLSSSKVILVFHSAWWKKSGAEMGGTVITDLPLKTIYYPTERNAKGLGIVLASYTWGGDSTRLLGMPDEEIFEEMMEGMAKVHGRSFKFVRAQFMRGVVKHWPLDPLVLGAFAGFHAYQTSEYQETLSLPEGRLHFAGEHTMTPHAWIDTAIHTGVRAAAEVHLGSNWWNPLLDDEDEEEGVKMNQKGETLRSLVYEGQHLG